MWEVDSQILGLNGGRGRRRNRGSDGAKMAHGFRLRVPKEAQSGNGWENAGK